MITTGETVGLAGGIISESCLVNDIIIAHYNLLFSYIEPAASNSQQEPVNRPRIDAKPQIRVRNPPGGKSSIQF